jgi:two-component system NarL family response regulator
MRVLIADDHALLIDGLRSLLEAHGIEVVGAVGDGEAAVSEALRLEPDVVLMDIRMPVCNGLAATRLIKAQRPDMKILIITTSAEDDDLFEAVKSGASGYLLKITRGPAFVDALRSLEQGIPPFSPGLAERIMREFARLGEAAPAQGEPGPAEKDNGRLPESGSPGRLSERQLEVLKLAAGGYTYKEIGKSLNLSEATVRYHMGEIMSLLHLRNRSQVIAYAASKRLIES